MKNYTLYPKPFTPLEEMQEVSWLQELKYLFAIPTAHAQTPDLLTGLIGHWKFDENLV